MRQIFKIDLKQIQNDAIVNQSSAGAAATEGDAMVIQIAIFILRRDFFCAERCNETSIVRSSDLLKFQPKLRYFLDLEAAERSTRQTIAIFNQRKEDKGRTKNDQIKPQN